MMNELDRKQVLAIAEAFASIDTAAFEPVMATMQSQSHRQGDSIISGGDREFSEYFVLNGILKTYVNDFEGREVTLGFFVGPCILTPVIARSAEGRSRVSCSALSECRVIRFPADVLIDCMVKNPNIQCWGDAVLRSELIRRAEREWALAALPARERLIQFRKEYPGLENQIAHGHIASYLGVTPVTLSRLRAQTRE